MDRREALAIVAAFSVALATDASAAPAIHEEAFIKIGGIEQWVTIKGSDSANPVILFLHGGPGDAMSPYADDTFEGWDKDFTLVQWDQRGAARTFGKSGPVEATITVDRMVRDGVELAEYLARHLHKRKIILVGGSWGSILGTNMVHARPDLFYAYVGQAQVVNWWENFSASYARVMELAQSANDQVGIAALKEIGPPPWHSLAQFPKFRKVQQQYQRKLVPQPHRYKISPEYSSAEARAEWHAADDSTFVRFVGLDFNGPLAHVDLRALGNTFSLPMFIIHGQEDLTALPGIARTWLEGLNAPVKQFYTVPATGHEPSPALIELTRKIITERVVPLTQER
jgi:pimeloyl-ACP methyl ester carboxylesterase